MQLNREVLPAPLGLDVEADVLKHRDAAEMEGNVGERQASRHYRPPLLRRKFVGVRGVATLTRPAPPGNRFVDNFVNQPASRAESDSARTPTGLKPGYSATSPPMVWGKTRGVLDCRQSDSRPVEVAATRRIETKLWLSLLTAELRAR
jgi:hypothetical protein